MSSKVIIDSKAALKHYNKKLALGESKMNQKKLGLSAGVRVQNLINLQKEATAACELILKIKEITGAPLDVILKTINVKKQ
ncbi:hypothetical protein [Tenacibaculum finnmarkense]|uniref:hypothetical protein n=1 Tax=Tenacibaculum finnmarkense TaxID=2781243 RepID=UPI002079AD4E|nr:hypothetical protein [Tenacibaculum finnmarkense]MCM8906795.1 hypothetical protein [Tenacibaculum finnmarkense genomovar finnmarkense]